MSQVNCEEKSPLLMGDENLRPRKRVSFDGSRIKDISFGANTVFKHFPNFIGTCWITTAFCGLIFFMIILILLSTLTANYIRVPRCVAGDELNNQTVHLVHSNEHSQCEPIEFDIIQKVIQNYQDFKIHLILINKEYVKTSKFDKSINETNTQKEFYTSVDSSSSGKETTTLMNKYKFVRRKKRKIADFRLNINVEAKKLLDILLNKNLPDALDNSTTSFISSMLSTNQITSKSTSKPMITIEDLIQKYPNIIVENTTYNQLFFNSPLYPYWESMSEDIRVFSVRVLQLWQYGGISFDLRPSPNVINNMAATNNTENHIDQIYNTKVMKFVITEKGRYNSLPSNVVAADDEGLHMESKNPCHAFFGELLMRLRKNVNNTPVQDIIKSSVSLFCKHYSASKKYCNYLNGRE